MEFFNNIFSLNNVGGANGLFKEAKSVSDHNFFNPESPLTLENYRKTYDQEHNSLAGDPKYVSVKDGNFFLSPSSPAIGAGKVLDNFTADSGVDMGAFQTSDNKLLPLRELEFVTSLQAVDFAFGDTAGRKIKLTATGKNVRIPFTIARTFEAEWLEVTPSKGMIESGKLSAGHARTLVKVPQEKQLAFANEALRRKFSVREMERAVKAYLTPPEVLKQEKAAKAAAKSEALKHTIEKMRSVLGMQVSLIGNDKKGRIYIDYHSAEDLQRLEEALGISDKAEQISLFGEDE
jgi:hypothetical protein